MASSVLPQQAFVNAVYDAALGFFQPQAALPFELGADLNRQGIGGGAFFAEIFKHAHIVKFVFVDKIQQFLEIFFRFSREAHNEIGTQGNIFHAFF